MKAIVKTILACLAFLAIVPVWLLYGLHRLVLGKDAACQAASQRASRWSGRTGEYLRRALMRRVLARVGEGVVISFGTLFGKAAAELDDGVYLGAYCVLGDVRIGRDTLVADHVCIPSGSAQHGTGRLDVPIRQQEGRLRTVRVGQDCWIGSGAIILRDVGDHCVVAAGSLVKAPVADYAIVAGNPAGAIGDRRQLAEDPSQRSAPDGSDQA